MTEQEFKDVQELWKLTYAHNAIDQVGRTIVFMLKHKIQRNHPLFNPLITSIYTTYGRPFTNNRPVKKLSLELFPPKQIGYHELIMRLRDQFFAHTDVGANKSKAHGPLLKVSHIFKANRSQAEFTDALHLQRGQLRQFLHHLVIIQPLIDGRKLLALHRLASHAPTTDGVF